MAKKTTARKPSNGVSKAGAKKSSGKVVAAKPAGRAKAAPSKVTSPVSSGKKQVKSKSTKPAVKATPAGKAESVTKSAVPAKTKSSATKGGPKVKANAEKVAAKAAAPASPRGKSTKVKSVPTAPPPAEAPATSRARSSSVKSEPVTKVKKRTLTRNRSNQPVTVSDRVAKIQESLRRKGGTPPRAVQVRELLSDDDLRKAKSGLAKRDIEHYRQQLMDKRAEILGDVKSLREDSRHGGSGGVSYEHMADTGTDHYDQEFNLELVESERQLLLLIDDALVRIHKGTYGVCVETGTPIGKTRLDAKPWAKFSIEVAREKERLGLRVL